MPEYKSPRVMLMNSAMMSVRGVYEICPITEEQFFDWTLLAHRNGVLINRIGYEQNIQMINARTALQLEPSRGACVPADGDYFLVMKLRYRATPEMKGTRVAPTDFEYSIGRYRAAALCIVDDDPTRARLEYNLDKIKLDKAPFLAKGGEKCNE